MNIHTESVCVEMLIIGLAIGCCETLVLGQPEPIRIPRLDRSLSVNSISNLRVAGQSEDGKELTLVMQYTYNGRAGATALLFPIVDRSDRPGVGGWFGADMVTVPQGSGPVSIKIKFFDDEPGAPRTLETDRVRVLILNQSGSSIIGGKNLLKTVKWGRDEGVAATSPDSVLDGREEIIRLATEAEDRARNQAKLAAEAEALALERIESSQSEQQKTDAQLLADRNAKIKAEASARATEAALIKKEQRELLADSMTPPVHEDVSPEPKMRITNIEIVNRSLDRSQMTLGIEFEPGDQFDFSPLLGVRIESTDVPGSETFFESMPVEVNKRKKVALVPVTFAPSADSHCQTLVTDKIAVFVTDESGTTNIPLEVATMRLTWREAGAVEPDAPKGGSIVLQEFRQRNQQSGYATVKYHLSAGPGELRVRVFDSNQPESASWFETESVPIEAGRGLELVPVGIASNGGFPGGEVVVNTVEVELLSQSGQVMEKVTRLTSINWSRED